MFSNANPSTSYHPAIPKTPDRLDIRYLILMLTLLVDGSSPAGVVAASLL